MNITRFNMLTLLKINAVDSERTFIFLLSLHTHTKQGKWEPGVRNETRQSGVGGNESSSVTPRRPVM